jgi:TorA maturation chaperone TorD
LSSDTHHETTEITEMLTETTEMMTTRLGVYQVLARLWIREVDEALWQGLLGTNFPSLPEQPELDSAYQKLSAFLSAAGPEVPRELTTDYAVLCRSANPHTGADPYESVHRNPLGLMMQDEWEEVLRFYRSIGFERSADAIEPEDHLGIELECMARLCQRYLDACEQGDTATAASSLRHQQHLLEAHLLLWVPRFASEVQKLAKTDFYRALATLTQEYLAMDAQYLKSLQAA